MDKTGIYRVMVDVIARRNRGDLTGPQAFALVRLLLFEVGAPVSDADAEKLLAGLGHHSEGEDNA